MMPLDSQALFDELCAHSKWRSHQEHFEAIAREMEADIKIACEENRRIAQGVRPFLLEEYQVKAATPESLAVAESTLLGGDVVGVDGTQKYYPMLSGGRAQIAVATVNYANQRGVATVYLSEHDFRTTSDDLIEALKQRRPGKMQLSQLAVRALMRYKELELGLARPEKWILYNGSYFPYELRTGAGSLRVVGRATQILRAAASRETVASIVAHSQEWHILSLGLALHSGEYFAYQTLDKELATFLYGDAELGKAPANLRGKERDAFEAFMNEVGPLISIGLVKIGSRSYQLQAATKHFDEAANIVIRDGLFQPIRGYPLLVDYADAVLSRMSSGSDFTRAIDVKLSKLGNLIAEVDERKLRRR